MTKRRYWLKLREDYFNSPKIKKLRSVAGGDTYALIYLELQCYSIKNEGIIEFEGLEDNLAKELALILDEEEMNVAYLLSYLEKYKLIDCIEENKYALVEAMGAIGSEAESTKRVREYRARQKALQCNDNVTDMKHDVTKCNDIYNKNKDIRNKNNIYNNIMIDINIINDYIKNNNLEYVDAEEFYNYYSLRDWKTKNGEPITNLVALLVSWNTRNKVRVKETRETQRKMNERHDYAADSNNVPKPVPLEVPEFLPENASDFLNKLAKSGKQSTVLQSIIGNLAKEKEME
ncbi:MAG: phage replisome organizer N-terminal domain-containing protein, partial [Megamonas funiformis]|uniref:phage replisome organizer N-terminal domain-containing protein n=1 Tax=Megamonas funiformis TaxID=437897 RepID=UPI001EB262FD